MAGTLVIDTVKSSTGNPAVFQNASGVEAGQLCRAWVNFNGATGTIRASFNVGSVTRNSAGNYTVNFTNAMPDANYSPSVLAPFSSGSAPYSTVVDSTAVVFSTSSYRFATIGTNNGGSGYDPAYCNVQIFR